MPRGIPKSGSASTSVLASSNSSAIIAPPPTRHASTRSAKIRANASILEHDKEIDALIRKHEKKGARGFAKVRENPTSITTTKTTTRAMEEDEQDERHSDLENDEASKQAASKSKRKKKDTSNTKGISKITKQAKAKLPKSDDEEVEGKKHTSKDTEGVDEEGNIFTSPQRPILGESARKNNSAQQTSTPPRIKTTKISNSAFASSSSPSKLKKNSQSSVLQSSPNRLKFVSPSKKRKGMPDIQIESFLENYDLEAENRIRMALKTLQISIDSTRTQMHAKAIAKLPRSVRLMRLGDFVNEYGANIQAAVERAAVVADRARQGAWEEEKMQRKRKGEEEQEDEVQKENDKRREGKSAKLNEAKNMSPIAKNTSQNGRSKLKKAVRKTKQVVRPSPLKQTESQAESSMRPPSSATFKPNLGADVVIAERTSSIPTLPPTPANGKARTARAGESVQWLSMNGSPIIGVVAPDGTIHAMPPTIQKSPSVTRQKQKSRNWQSIEDEASDAEGEDLEDAAETSAHLLELAKGIDGFKRSRDSKGSSPERQNARIASTSNIQSPISRSSLHTAQASRRGTLDAAESEEGESIFEEARSHPDEERGLDLSDEDDCSLPDEEAYTAQIMREEAQKRARMLSSEPKIARSSTSSKAAFGNGNVGRSSDSNSLTGMTSKQNNARGSHSTIRATSLRKDQMTSNGSRSSSSSGFLAMPSSPMVRNHSSNSSKRIMSMSSSTSSSPSKERVSIVFGSGSRHKIAQLGVEDLMKLSAQERNQMLEILEKLKQAQSNLDTR